MLHNLIPPPHPQHLPDNCPQLSIKGLQELVGDCLGNADDHSHEDGPIEVVKNPVICPTVSDPSKYVVACISVCMTA